MERADFGDLHPEELSLRLKGAAIILQNLDFQNPNQSKRNTMSALTAAGMLPEGGGATFNSVKNQILEAVLHEVNVVVEASSTQDSAT